MEKMKGVNAFRENSEFLNSCLSFSPLPKTMSLEQTVKEKLKPKTREEIRGAPGNTT